MEVTITLLCDFFPEKVKWCVCVCVCVCALESLDSTCSLTNDEQSVHYLRHKKENQIEEKK